jgi:hypothetical protein
VIESLHARNVAFLNQPSHELAAQVLAAMLVVVDANPTTSTTTADTATAYTALAPLFCVPPPAPAPLSLCPWPRFLRDENLLPAKVG